MHSEFNEDTFTMIVAAFGGVIVLAVIIGLVCLGAYIGRKAGGEAKKSTRVLCLVPTVISILISLVGFVTNFGWYRFMMTYMLLPVWYPLLLIISSSAAAATIKKSGTVKVIYLLSHILYVVSGLAMPDGGDDGSAYVFFGQIKCGDYGLEAVAVTMFVYALALIIVQIIIARDHRKALEKQNK